MTTLQSRLPVIAIALAIVAAGLLTTAIVMRRRTSAEPAPAAVTQQPIVRQRPDAQVAPAASDPPASPDDPTVQASPPDAGTCIPCQGCRPTTCTCNDGSITSSFHCVNGCCLSALQTCEKICASRNGVAPP